MTTEPQVAITIDDRVLTIMLDRPDRMNAFTPDMLTEMITAFDRADADEDVRAVIVTGNGDRAFCAGADLSEGASTFDYSDGPVWSDGGSPVREDGSVDWSHPGVRDGGGLLTLRIYRSRKPVIGAINGAAVGIGATMILPMDHIVASETARFGFLFARRGIVPEAASSWFLPRRVGITTALDWCFSGRMVDAEEAARAGLVQQVVPASVLIEQAHRAAHRLTAESAPVSIALTRTLMWRMLGASSPMDAHRLDSRLMWERGGSADAREGVAAFLERRLPIFRDRVDAASAILPDGLRDLPW